MVIHFCFHSPKDDGDFNEQTIVDDLSERQNVSIMNEL